MRKFGRFKYAEEYAHKLDSQGIRWVMYNVPNVEHYEDGDPEPYIYTDYYVQPYIDILDDQAAGRKYWIFLVE